MTAGEDPPKIGKQNLRELGNQGNLEEEQQSRDLGAP